MWLVPIAWIGFAAVTYGLQAFHMVGTTNEAVLVTTGLTVLWYTVETFRLRDETVTQREIQLRPLVVLAYGYSSSEHIAGPIKGHVGLVASNIGQGAALEVTVGPLQIAEGELRFEPVDVLIHGETKAVKVESEFWTSDVLDPRLIPRPHEVTVRYADIEGRAYESQISVGRAGYRLVSTKRARQGSLKTLAQCLRKVTRLSWPTSRRSRSS